MVSEKSQESRPVLPVGKEENQHHPYPAARQLCSQHIAASSSLQSHHSKAIQLLVYITAVCAPLTTRTKIKGGGQKQKAES